MKTYGFIPSKIESNHYILGGTGLPKTILQPLGNWERYLPAYEPQFENFETAGCTVWGTQNCCETLFKRLYSEEPNYSERFTYILAGVRPPGADPHKVAEVIRTKGLIDHTLLENNSPTLEEFVKPDPMTKELIDKGEEWLNLYDFGHEWLWTTNLNKKDRLDILKEYLQYSPVCVSVSAWSTDPDTGLYVSNFPNNHWVMCYGIADESLLVFDSYGQDKKRLHPDHEIMMAKRYYIGPSTRQEKLTWIETILKWIQEQVNSLKKKDMPPYKPIEEVIPPIINQSIYDWSNTGASRHSVRVICDDEGLSIIEKNELCATIGGESNWNPKAVGKPNFDGSRDYGIIQLNDHYWIGKDKLFPDVDYVLNNPEKCVRWMCKQWKLGNKNWWYAYKNKSYLKYL
jgi:hypothetical protein